MDTNAVSNLSDVAWITKHQRERIANSPLLPDCIQWSEDGRIAVVTDNNVVITSFKNQELELYLENPPVISRSFIYSSQHLRNDSTTPNSSKKSRVSKHCGSTSYLIMHTKKKRNAKEISLSKNCSESLVTVVWGPRGSGPHATCAIIALDALSRSTLHFMSSFHLNWKQVDTLSDHIERFFKQYGFDITKVLVNAPISDNVMAISDAQKKVGLQSTNKNRRKTGKSTGDTISDEDKEILLSTLSIAWSGFYVIKSNDSLSSLIAFSGKLVTTIWLYRYPTLVALKKGTGQDTRPEISDNLLAKQPLGLIVTEEYGWVTASSWHNVSQRADGPGSAEELLMALGTSEGNVLLVGVPLSDPTSLQILKPRRVIRTPGMQPVVTLRLVDTCNKTCNLIIASGPNISVYNAQEKNSDPVSWTAHEGSISGMAVSFFGDIIVSAALDRRVKSWHMDTSNLTANTIYREKEVVMADKPYPLYGVAISPLSLQIACVHIIPPANRPNRQSQADMSYTRVACAIEMFRAELLNDVDALVSHIKRILVACNSTSDFLDLVWFCHQELSYSMADDLSEMAVPSLLKHITDVDMVDVKSEQASESLIMLLCHRLHVLNQDTFSATSTVRPAMSRMNMMLLQTLYLLRCHAPEESPDEGNVAQCRLIRRTIYTIWAENCLHRLCASGYDPSQKQLSDSEILSALLMADFLSVQKISHERTLKYVANVYEWFGTMEDIQRLDYNQNHHMSESFRIPSGRQNCFICGKLVSFSELDISCENGHEHQRCFLSFKIIESVSAWRCSGCNECANALDFSKENAPFYFLEEFDVVKLHQNNIQCRFCGSICSYFQYGFCDVAS